MTKSRQIALSALGKAQKIKKIRYVIVSQRLGKKLKLTTHGFNHAYVKTFDGTVLPQRIFFGFMYLKDAMRVENR